MMNFSIFKTHEQNPSSVLLPDLEDNWVWSLEPSGVNSVKSLSNHFNYSPSIDELLYGALGSQRVLGE